MTGKTEELLWFQGEVGYVLKMNKFQVADRTGCRPVALHSTMGYVVFFFFKSFSAFITNINSNTNLKDGKLIPCLKKAQTSALMLVCSCLCCHLSDESTYVCPESVFTGFALLWYLQYEEPSGLIDVVNDGVSSGSPSDRAST